MNVGVSSQGRVNTTIHEQCCMMHGLHTKKKTTLVIQVRKRKKHIHEETKENFGEGGEDCPPLPVSGTEFCLLDGAEDFVDDRPASKRFRQGSANYDCYGLSSNDEEE